MIFSTLVAFLSIFRSKDVTPKAEAQFDIGVAKNYNAFFLDSVYINSGVTGGRFASGGNTLLSSYSIGTGLFQGGASLSCGLIGQIDSNFSLNQYALVVDDALLISNTVVRNGGIAFGSSKSIIAVTEFDVGTDCQIVQKRNLIDFNQARETLKSVSAQMAQLNQTSSYNLTGSTLNLIFNGKVPVEVFYINSADVLNADFIAPQGTPMNNSSILINLSGKTSGANNMGMFELQNWSSRILWNMYQADTVIIRSVDWRGSILAPNANVDNPNAALYGQIWANSINSTNDNGSLAINWVPFQGTLLK
jgi:choice-of-anchor A domain-containing protein